MSNTKGYSNTAIGYRTLKTNSTGYHNTGTGYRALETNSTGNNNTGNGHYALFSNTTGYVNTALGSSSLFNNVSGYSNTAVGYNSLGSNASGWQNTSVGASSLTLNTSGSYNTALGYNTGPNSNNYANTTCVGIDATATASNMVRIGNVFVTSIGGYVNWSNISDARVKEDVAENVPGLSFISQLRPVTYRLNREQINEATGVNERRRRIRESNPDVQFLPGDALSPVTTGFIAQEVEQAARSLGFEFSGVDRPANANGLYGLRYAEFVVPLVKAVQEQQDMIAEQNRRLEGQEAAISARDAKLDQQEKMIRDQQQQIDELKRMVEKLIGK